MVASVVLARPLHSARVWTLPTLRIRHRAHGTSAACCRRRFAHRSGHSRSTAPNVLLMVASPLRVPQASCRTVPSAWADGQIPASGPRHARGPLPSPIRPSKRPLPIHSTRCASYTGAGPRDGTVSLSQLMSSCSQETTARCECRV